MVLGFEEGENIEKPVNVSVHVTDTSLKPDSGSEKLNQKDDASRRSSRCASSKSSKSTKASDFEFETRYLVLNYFGLVPIGPQNLNASGSSSSGNAASLLYSQASFDSGKSGKFSILA